MSSGGVQCPSCGAVFPHAKFAEGSRCSQCTSGKPDEPQCVSCGIIFPKLKGEICGSCASLSGSSRPLCLPLCRIYADIDLPLSAPIQRKSFDSSYVLKRVDKALETPHNPRKSSHQRSASLTSTKTGAFVANFRDRLNAQPKHRPPPAPISDHARNTPPARAGIFISVTSMFFNAVLKKDFTPYSEFYKPETGFQDVLEDIRKHVDVECSRILDVPLTPLTARTESDDDDTSDGPLTLMERSETFDLAYFYDTYELGKGKTKVVHKLRRSEDGPFYTAKKYYQGDTDGEVTTASNFKWLRQEMIRAVFAARVTENFVTKTKRMNISIHDIAFLVPVILHEHVKGSKAGAWLSDELVHGEMQKFSGTYQAGQHLETDLAGITCDALAHWSFSTGSKERVFVDLQADSGVGDGGEHGIQTFKEQHKCNRICRQLDLPPLIDSVQATGEPIEGTKESEESTATE
ncbi:3470_t:CDS:2 [Acaulospora colombiana]|uniref:3470_t:CDS:1 n=1 Tax=Acaulospora colombiana TaxID=27376 RepID=A0ACA9L7R1_9GLOM|nr:3470_t:CDS:2 [Acaulospora colombiana]